MVNVVTTEYGALASETVSLPVANEIVAVSLSPIVTVSFTFPSEARNGVELARF